jgi:hypothetical protein
LYLLIKERAPPSALIATTGVTPTTQAPKATAVNDDIFFTLLFIDFLLNIYSSQSDVVVVPLAFLSRFCSALPRCFLIHKTIKISKPTPKIEEIIIANIVPDVMPPDELKVIEIILDCAVLV